MHGFLKLQRHERLFGRLPDWCGATQTEDHARWCFDPATVVVGGITLGQIATAASIVGLGLQVTGTLAAGKAEKQAAEARAAALEHRAKQAKQAAGQERAASQRASGEQRRHARLVESQALARAAASGAGAADPTVENILGEIGAEGEFRALSELFIGEERARGLETQADINVFEAADQRRAGAFALSSSRTKAFGQTLRGAAKLVPKTTLGSGRGLGQSARARTDPRTGRLFGPV